MSQRLQKAIKALEQLPQDRQNVIAQQILDELDEDVQWDITLADPRSEVVLDRPNCSCKGPCGTR